MKDKEKFKFRFWARIGMGLLPLIIVVGGAVTAALSQNGETSVYLPLIRTADRPIASDEWPMVAANPERTSWTSEEVSGPLQLQWYHPIEAYIPQNVQIIASNGLLYISTARGL